MSTSINFRVADVAVARATATPALARISPIALAQFLVRNSPEPARNLPLAGTQSGNLFNDRFDPKLRWYTPIYSLAIDPDPAFTFAAAAAQVDERGNQFNTARISLGLQKIVPDDVTSFRAANPTIQFREIPLSSFSASLIVSFKDSSSGEDRHTAYSGTVKTGADNSLSVSFENVLGPGVIVVWENLLQDGKAELSLSATYEVWREAPASSVPSPPGQLRAHVETAASVDGRAVRMYARSTAPIRSEIPANNRLGTAARPLAFRRFSTDAMVMHVPERSFAVGRPTSGPPNSPAATKQYQVSTSTLAFRLPVGKKYAASAYALNFTITNGFQKRPIISVNDLKNFDVKQSEFKELKVLGDISNRYPSLSRVYIGVLSKQLIVIPRRYAIVRTTHGVGAVCRALLDSASTAENKCKFEFDFLIAPDVSAIDLLQLSQELQSHPDLKGYTVKVPEFLKEGTNPKLLTAFQSSASYSAALDPHTFTLSVEIKDEPGGSDAVANANLLIKQLCAEAQPYLFATISLKLDDFYAEPVDANAVLNFKETSGTDELTFKLDESAGSINFINQSPFDLNVSRYALCTPEAVNIVSHPRIIKSGDTVAEPLPQGDHQKLTVLIDRELSIAAPISKSDISKYLGFQTSDVQNTQFAFGINASGINFEARGISAIAVRVLLPGLPDLAVPSFSLVNLRKVDGSTAVVPLHDAVTSLHATVEFTTHFLDPHRSDVKFTLEHEFIDDPILVLKDSDLPAT